jgi:hypothetical protein
MYVAFSRSALNGTRLIEEDHKYELCHAMKVFKCGLEV